MTAPASPLAPEHFEALVQDLKLDGLPQPLGTSAPGHRFAADDGHPAELVRRSREELAPGGTLFLHLPQDPGPEALAKIRNELWPGLHAAVLYRSTPSKVTRETPGGAQVVDGLELPLEGAIIVLRRREDAMSPDVTIAKFDKNASGWNGDPKHPGYGHHRWMRRYVGTFVQPKAGARILDFGSGAGWVGLEAALRSPGSHLCAFDPSPEMVRIAGENAQAAGLSFAGRTGFGEAPPFPAAGEEPFDLVLSSGVISFSPDFESWYTGLDRAVAAGGTLVIGDIQRSSRGFQRRRRMKPILPTREMNAQTHQEVRRELERRGFVHQRTRGYQLTRPIPEAMHVSETRLKGLLSPALLLLNRISAPTLGSFATSQFDSWVMHFERK